MKILLITPFDAGGSKIQLCRGINKFTDHKCRFIAQARESFTYPYDIIIKEGGTEKTDRLAQSADVFIFFLRDYTYSMLPMVWEHYLDGKKVLFNKNSSKLEYPDDSFYEAHNIKLWTHWAGADPDYDWCPVFRPISKLKPRLKKYGWSILLGQSPSDPNRKNTKELVQVYDSLLEEGWDIDLSLLTGMDYAEMIKEKNKWHIAFDNFQDGHEGGAGWEALAMGIPCMTNLKKEQDEAIKKWGDESQPFTMAKDKPQLKKCLEEFLENRIYLKEKSEDLRVWMEKYMSEERILNRLFDIIEDTKTFRR